MKKLFYFDGDRPSFGVTDAIEAISSLADENKNTGEKVEKLLETFLPNLSEQFKSFTSLLAPFFKMFDKKGEEESPEAEADLKEDNTTEEKSDVAPVSIGGTSADEKGAAAHDKKLESYAPYDGYKDLEKGTYRSRKDWAAKCKHMKTFMESKYNKIPARVARALTAQMHRKSDKIRPDMQRKFGAEEATGKYVVFTLSHTDKVTGKKYEVVMHGRGDIHGKNLKTGVTGRTLGFSARLKNFKVIPAADVDSI